MESLKLLFIIATTYEPGFGILCMLISSSVGSMTRSGGNAAVCRLETCSKRKPWFCWEEIFFFFPNQQIYQVNFIHFNLVINLVKSLNLQLYVVWQNSLYYYAALNLPKFLLQPIRKQNTVKRA